MARQDTRLRVLLCNVHATSKPWLLFPWLFTLLTVLRVDAVLLQELTPGHVRALERRKAWKLLASNGSGVLIRLRLTPDHPRVTALGVGWWGHQVSRPHEGRHLPHVRVAGWLRVGSVHMPPGVGFTTSGAMTGVADRKVAWRKAMVAFARLLKRRAPSSSVAELWGGDWNESRLSTGRLSPAWLAQSFGLTFAGRGIDYVGVRGCQVSSWRRVGRGPGMDHDAVLYVVDR